MLNHTNSKLIASYILIAILLSACASMPISSMWKLRKLDMLSVDPQDLHIAVITNSLVQLQDGSTSITISFSSEEAAHNFSYRLVTTIDRDAQLSSLDAEIGSEDSMTLFYLSDTQAKKLRLAQSRILAVREQGIEGDGSMSIDINTGCFSAAPPKTLDTDIFAQFDRQQGFIKMQSDIDLMKLARKSGKSFWSECQASKG